MQGDIGRYEEMQGDVAGVASPVASVCAKESRCTISLYLAISPYISLYLACREGLSEGEPLCRPHVECGEAAR